MPCDIVFLYPENAPVPVREAAETCARIYGSRNAVRAQAFAVTGVAVTDVAVTGQAGYGLGKGGTP
jgi:hypothetical protein